MDNKQAWYGNGNVLPAALQAEQDFYALAEQRGYSPRKSSLQENMNHVDVWLYRVTPEGRERVGVDVKGMKRIARGDAMVNPDWVWLELESASGGLGWLRRGADVIAFQQPTGFLLVNRLALLTWVNRVISREVSLYPYEAGYMLYERRGSLLTLVKVADIRNEVFSTFWKIGE